MFYLVKKVLLSEDLFHGMPFRFESSEKEVKVHLALGDVVGIVGAADNGRAADYLGLVTSGFAVGE